MITLTLFTFVFGLLVGSFINVVIARVPHGKSVVTPRSKCPHCAYQIKWYENIPLISYLALKGRCSNCGKKVSIQYPLVELLCGLFAVLLIPSRMILPELIIFFCKFFISTLFLAHFIIDIKYQLLPDKINIWLAIIVATFALYTKDPLSIALGGIIGFGSTYLVTYLFYKLKGQIGLGGGDIKLFGILGLYLGPVGVLNCIFMSSLLGSIIGVLLIISKKLDKNKPLAFGPYILIVAAAQIFFPYIFQKINFMSF